MFLSEVGPNHHVVFLTRADVLFAYGAPVVAHIFSDNTYIQTLKPIYTPTDRYLSLFLDGNTSTTVPHATFVERVEGRNT